MTGSTQTVFITGAAKRIGRHLALHFARSGWDVAIHYGASHTEAQQLAEEIAVLGRRSALVQADFAGSFDADALMRQATDALGPIHGLINNASVFEKDMLGSITPERFEQQMRVNALAPLLLCQAFAAHVRERRIADANIILIGDSAKGWSMSGKYVSYALSKLGLMALPELLAIELAPHIRINAVAPGPTLPGKDDAPDTFARLTQRSPLKRLSDPDEICRAIDFLLATPTVTGQSILLAGGFHLHQPVDIDGGD